MAAAAAAAVSVPSLGPRLHLAPTCHARLSSPRHFRLNIPSIIKTAAGRWHYQSLMSLGSAHQRMNSWKPLCCYSGSSTNINIGGVEPNNESSSLSTIIRQFYACINDKKNGHHDQLNEFITDDCFFEDLAFPRPFQGRKAVNCFLRDLKEAMGKHVRFAIEQVCEGDQSTVAVVWHLEWNEERIPFTKGCSIFECSNGGQPVLIKKACVFVESPVKLGDFVLELLKLITGLFDKFPGLTQKFLQKPYIIAGFFIKMYKIFVEPFILPILVYYTHLWRFCTRMLSFILGLVQTLLKIFM